MPFTYKIIANPTGARPFRAAVDNGPTIEGSVFLAEVTTEAGPNPTVEAVFRACFTVIARHAAKAERIGDVLGLLRVFPTCGGSYPVPDPSADDVRQTVTFNITPTPEFIASFIAGLAMEKTGESGLIAPEISSVVVMPGGQSDAYSPGKGLEIRGEHLRGRGGAIPTVRLSFPGAEAGTLDLLVLDASDARLVCTVPLNDFPHVPSQLTIIAPYGSESRTSIYASLLAFAP